MSLLDWIAVVLLHVANKIIGGLTLSRLKNGKLLLYTEICEHNSVRTRATQSCDLHSEFEAVFSNLREKYRIDKYQPL